MPVFLYEKKNLFEKVTLQSAKGAAIYERVVVSNAPGVRAIVVANNRKADYVLIGLNDATPAYLSLFVHSNL